MPTILTNDERLKILQRLHNDLTFYAPKCLKIRDKAGALISFKFNKAQIYLHNKIEEQKRRTGKVRVVLVKGRQMGCSTYVGARYFHQASLNEGIRVFILAHLADATRNLFKMVGAFYDNAPEPIKPAVKVSNQRNLEFANLGSEYSIGTAGSEDVGRSMTVQRFHGSECAYWENTDSIMSGVLQGVPDLPGTEIIFESTANGMGNLFHALAIKGLSPESEFQTIFLPWFWQDEYRRPVPNNFMPTEEEVKLMTLHGLDEEQIMWRRIKIHDVFNGKIWEFMREYPCTVQEAFITSGETLLDGEKVQRARKCEVHDPVAPLILGVDPARKGDRTILVWRRGREIIKFRKYTEMDEMTLAGIIAQILDKDDILKCFIDVGMGYGTVDRLRELGYGDRVVGVHFGSGALQPDVYQNKRCEMADEFRKWFEDGDVSIPDDDEFVTDILSCPPLKPTTSRGLLTLPPKDKIKETLGKSPDIFDAVILTFAFPVARDARRNRITRKEPEMIRKTSPLATVRRFAGRDFKGGKSQASNFSLT